MSNFFLCFRVEPRKNAVFVEFTVSFLCKSHRNSETNYSYRNVQNFHFEYRTPMGKTSDTNDCGYHYCHIHIRSPRAIGISYHVCFQFVQWRPNTKPNAFFVGLELNICIIVYHFKAIKSQKKRISRVNKHFLIEVLFRSRKTSDT